VSGPRGLCASDLLLESLLRQVGAEVQRLVYGELDGGLDLLTKVGVLPEEESFEVDDEYVWEPPDVQLLRSLTELLAPGAVPLVVCPEDLRLAVEPHTVVKRHRPLRPCLELVDSAVQDLWCVEGGMSECLGQQEPGRLLRMQLHTDNRTLVVGSEA